MLTDQQREAQRAMLESGMVSADRLRALKHGLLARRDDARAAGKADGLDERFAASLRGKANAYQEAANLVQQLLYGAPMRPAPWSTAVQKARAYHDRRNARIAARDATER